MGRRKREPMSEGKKNIIGNNLLSNAIKFTENGAVSLTMG